MALGARERLADQGRIRGAEKYHLVRSRIQSADRQWQGRRGNRLAAYRRNGRDGQRAVARGPGPQARHSARAQRPQSESQDRAHQGAGRLHRSQGLLRAQAAPARHGCAGYRSGDDHSDRHRYLSVAAERRRRARRCARRTTIGHTSTARRIPSGSISPRCSRCRIPNSPSRKFIASRTRDAASAWCGRSMRWAIIRFSPSTSACGARWKRPASCTGCIRFRPSDRSSRRATPSSTRAPS